MDGSQACIHTGRLKINVSYRRFFRTFAHIIPDFQISNRIFLFKIYDVPMKFAHKLIHGGPVHPFCEPLQVLQQCIVTVKIAQFKTIHRLLGRQIWTF